MLFIEYDGVIQSSHVGYMPPSSLILLILLIRYIYII